MTAILDSDADGAQRIQSVLGSDITTFTSTDALRRHLAATPDENVVVVGSNVSLATGLALAEAMRVAAQALQVILIRRQLDASVLDKAMRAGVNRVVEERDLQELTLAVREATQLAQLKRELIGNDEPELPMATVVTVCSAKGGSGKTTLATNLSFVLADEGRRKVCLIDLDLSFGDVAISLHLLPTHTIADAVTLADTLDHSAITSLLTPHPAGFTTLLAPVEPGVAESIKPELTSKIIGLLREAHDYVVIDTPAALDGHLLEALDQSDFVALLTTPDITALRSVSTTLETLELLSYPPERYRLVLNRSDSKVGLTHKDVEHELDMRIWGFIPSSRDVPVSINRGVPIVKSRPRHAVSQAIRTLAQSLVPAATQSDEAQVRSLQQQRRRRWLRWLQRRQAPGDGFPSSPPGLQSPSEDSRETDEG